MLDVIIAICRIGLMLYVLMSLFLIRQAVKRIEKLQLEQMRKESE